MKLFLFSLALSLSAISMGAATVVDAGPPTTNGSVSIVNQRLADDFVLSGSADINQINFWWTASSLATSSKISWAVYSNLGGQLGGEIAGGVATASSTPSALTNTYFAQFAIPDLMLSSGTYWLELHEGSTLQDNSGSPMAWVTGSGSPSYAALTGGDFTPLSNPITQQGQQQYAFQLIGPGSPVVTTPEPSTLLVTGGGLVGLALLLKRRRQRLT